MISKNVSEKIFSRKSGSPWGVCGNQLGIEWPIRPANGPHFGLSEPQVKYLTSWTVGARSGRPKISELWLGVPRSSHGLPLENYFFRWNIFKNPSIFSWFLNIWKSKKMENEKNRKKKSFRFFSSNFQKSKNIEGFKKKWKKNIFRKKIFFKKIVNIIFRVFNIFSIWLKFWKAYHL